MSKRTPDHFYHRAKEAGYAARSVFKLEEIDRKQKLFKKKQRVLDLGASPGSWLQYISQKIGPKGLAIGIDLNPVEVELPENVLTFAENVFGEGVYDLLHPHEPFDVLVSDMAPKTSGVSDRDHFRSIELALRAAEIGEKVLKKDGVLLCKYFQGKDEKELEDRLKQSFQKIKRIKPDASRKKSRETYVLALQKRH